MSRGCTPYLFGFGILLFILKSSSAGAAETGMATIRYAVSGRTAADWPVHVGKEKKFFQKNGVYLEDIVIPGGPNTVRAVISNTVPMGRINPDRIIEAAEKGAKVRVISGDMQKIPYDFMARTEIKSGSDLRGKLIGVDSLTGGTTFMLQEVAQKAYGLTDKDYKLLVVGTSPERYAALKGGSVQATFMGPPFNLRARKDGFNRLTTFHEHLGPIQFVATFAHEAYLKSNRADVIRFVKAMIESTRWLYDAKNKEEALAIYMRYLKATPDAAEMDYRYLVEEFKPWPNDGAINKQAIAKTMELRVKAGKYEPNKVPSYAQYVDFTLVEEAQKQLGIRPG
jgi:ABC-type nitrate/sulfonate/bicarbonate transport system substrate-binding protein